jgi:hypothetical protein
MTPDILSYNQRQLPEWQDLCTALARDITAGLPEATARIYHAAPVWFLNDNPIVGYWVRKAHVQLLFWSGQSFTAPGLRPEGTFKAAEARFTSVSQIDGTLLERWLAEARILQWDYKNIVKRRGVLEWLGPPGGGLIRRSAPRVPPGHARGSRR